MADFENNSHYVPSRLSLWCPICGAREGQGCKPVKGTRFTSHDAYALGTVPRPQVVAEPANYPAPRMLGNRPKWTPQRWVQ